MSDASSELAKRRCKPCAPGTAPLGPDAIERLLSEIDGWNIVEGAIVKTYRFADYSETLAFVNATAWISHRQDHHPDLLVGYDTCRVQYRTHAAGGLTENDFICAAQVDALLRP